MDLLKKLASTKEKYNLYIEVHNLKADFKQECSLMIKIKRGRTKSEDTPAKNYSPQYREVIFEHSVHFRITAYRNHRNLMHKILKFKLFRKVNGKTKQDGEAEVSNIQVEITELAESGRSLIQQFLRIKGCSDPKAEVCVSIEMQPAEKSRANSVIDK
jgi:hypothetical protein